MDREEIIRMAREAGIGPVYGYESIERFAALVAAHEREACAKVCEILEAEDDSFYAEFSGAIDCATAIRARGDR